MEEIKHFDHLYHLLSLSNVKRADQILCEACREYCHGETYICSKGCRYSLHESCAKLPREVQSPFHLTHPLTLQRPRSSDRFQCNGCRDDMDFSGFVYRCNNCNFDLDRECAMMGTVKVIEEGLEKLRTHPNHQHHPLQLFEKVPNRRYKCTVCLEHCSEDHQIYGCIPCRLFIHGGSCFERNLPPQIQHFFHPHSLTLSFTPSHRKTICQACTRSSTIYWYYYCKQCNFVMDVACALLPTTIKSESLIQHFLHGHPLSFRNNKVDDKKIEYCCRICDKRCTGPTYVCEYCNNIHFHKSCLDKFPQQICHQFHPYHPLTLTLEGNQCKACCKSGCHYYQKSGYICQGHDCNFFLHAECSTVMMPAIKYEGHTHLLQFRDGNIENNRLWCSTCNSCISELYAFTCLYCSVNLHLHCGPLPYTVKHKDHNIHPLVLTNSPLQEEVEDETDEFYCHACEEERDSQLPVYYCAECQFVAEVKCVISEVR